MGSFALWGQLRKYQSSRSQALEAPHGTCGQTDSVSRAIFDADHHAIHFSYPPRGENQVPFHFELNLAI